MASMVVLAACSGSINHTTHQADYWVDTDGTKRARITETSTGI